MKRVRLGTIVRTHGLHGAFVVKTDSGKESSLGALKQIFLGENAAQSSEIQEAAWMPSGWKVSIGGVDSIEAAQALKGTELFGDREQLPTLTKNEYYLNDLEGCIALDASTSKEIGRFKGIESHSGSDLWRFEINGKSVLVTPTRHFISKVETSKKLIYLSNVDELLELA